MIDLMNCRVIAAATNNVMLWHFPDPHINHVLEEMCLYVQLKLQTMLKMGVFKILIILFLNQTLWWDHSLESSSPDDSNEEVRP